MLYRLDTIVEHIDRLRRTQRGLVANVL